MRESIETIQEKFVERDWARCSPEDQRFKLAQFVQGQSLGADIPQAVKQRHFRSRRVRKIALTLCMISVVVLMA